MILEAQYSKEQKRMKKIALSIEDQAFLEIMDKNVHMNETVG